MRSPKSTTSPACSFSHFAQFRESAISPHPLEVGSFSIDTTLSNEKNSSAIGISSLANVTPFPSFLARVSRQNTNILKTGDLLKPPNFPPPDVTSHRFRKSTDFEGRVEWNEGEKSNNGVTTEVLDLSSSTGEQQTSGYISDAELGRSEFTRMLETEYDTSSLRQPSYSFSNKKRGEHHFHTSCYDTNCFRMQHDEKDLETREELANAWTRRGYICYSCGKQIQSEKSLYHPFWPQDIICRQCSNIAPRCLVCERPSQGWNEPKLSLGIIGGRETFFLCKGCYSSGTAETDGDLSSIISQALDYLRYHPLIRIDMQSDFTLLTHFDYHRPPPPSDTFPHQPLLINYTDIHALCKPIDENHLVPVRDETIAAWSEEIVFGKFHTREHQSKDISFTIYEIQLCRGLQKDTLVSVLAHELLHAYICLKRRSKKIVYQKVIRSILHGKTMNLEDEEALCNAITALYLEDQNTVLSHRKDIVSMVRAEICHFRHRRLMVGDIMATRRVGSALKFVKAGGLRLHLSK